MEETVKWQDGQRWSGQASLSFLVFITISVVVFFRIGCQLVITAWLAVQLTGRANAVGTILLISSVTHLVCSPVIGKLVDTFKKKEARDYLWSLGRALAGAFPLTMKWISLNQDSFVILAIVVVLATISGLFANGAIDYYTKIYIPITQRGQKLALMGAITQVALLFGTTIGSIILTKLSFSESFIVISVCSITAAAICLFFLPEITIKNTENSNRKRHFFLAELYLYFKYPTLFSVAGCAVLVFSIGQITNTLLPALISLS
ncbi:MAG: MFS transporter [Candidatus Symbiodolus clandestinus]